MKKIYDHSSIELVKFNLQPLVSGLYSTLRQAFLGLDIEYTFKEHGGIIVLEAQEDLLDLQGLYLSEPLSKTPLDACWLDTEANCWVATVIGNNDFCTEYIIPAGIVDQETLDHFEAESFDGLPLPIAQAA